MGSDWHAVSAVTPIAVILVLMILRGWPAAQAALAGLAIALPLSIFVFGFGGEGDGIGMQFTGVVLEAGTTTTTILWIIFPALCIFELLRRHDAFDTIKQALGRVTDDPRLLALLVAWFFALFLEGAAGFGTPVALAAPLLVSLGFPPVRAVTIVLIGHATGVSFGAIGTPVFAQVSITNLPPLALAAQTALLHVVLCVVLAGAVYWLAVPGGRRNGALRPRVWPLPAAVLCFIVPFYGLAAFVGPELPTLLGAVIGGVLFAGGLALVRLSHPIAENAHGVAEGHGWLELSRSLLPYGVLISLILITRLVEPVRVLAGSVVWSWHLDDQFSGQVLPLSHPGTMLFLSFVIGGIVLGERGSGLVRCASLALRRLMSVVLALLGMLALARLMVHAGMVDALAMLVAEAAGPSWPVFAPMIGVLGTFVTGSATASNILFTDFQAETADILELPVLMMVAAQCFGAAIGNMVCPHNVIAGAATVGLEGKEGDVLRRTTLVGVVYGVAGGGLVWLLVAGF
ncbi:L-lactate permease [Pyruvatibacter mobilis]|uniref:L-lactate permease n=1 Tax=Pyruvatibacter mobilis TaxID=1712261 RepID=UPI003BAD6341